MLKLVYKIYVILIIFGLLGGVSKAYAEGIFSDSLWESRQISDTVLSLATDDVNQDYLWDIVYVTKHKMVVQSFTEIGLIPIAKLELGKQFELNRIWIGDWDKDGIKDILVTGFFRGLVFSRIYHLVDKKFVQIKEFDTLVVPLTFNGQSSLYSQTWLGQGRWANQIYPLTCQQAKCVTGSDMIINKDLSPNEQSLLSLATFQKNMIFLTDDRKLLVLNHAGKKVWKSGISYGGSVDAVDFEYRDPLGIQTQKSMLIPPRMLVDDNQIYVFKNEGYLKSIVGAVPNIKESQIVLLKWTGDGGFQERKNSPRYQGAFSDMQLVDFDGNGQKEILMAFLVSKKGYLDAYDSRGTVFVLMSMP